MTVVVEVGVEVDLADAAVVDAMVVSIIDVVGYGLCFTCQSPDHFQANCPYGRNDARQVHILTAPTQLAAPAPPVPQNMPQVMAPAAPALFAPQYYSAALTWPMGAPMAAPMAFPALPAPAAKDKNSGNGH